MVSSAWIPPGRCAGRVSEYRVAKPRSCIAICYSTCRRIPVRRKAAQVEVAIHRLIKLHGRDYWAERVIKLVIHNKPPYPDGKYLIKGGGPKVWKRFNLRKEHRRLQGIIHGKRCGTTQNIGPVQGVGHSPLKETGRGGVMLKPLRHCTHCGAEMQTVRSTKAYCSEACRKKTARGGIEQQAESRWIVECLRRMGLVAKIWPVYTWDQSPAIFALMVTSQAAVDELNLSAP